MTSLIISLGLSLAVGAAGQYPGQAYSHYNQGGWILPPGPG